MPIYEYYCPDNHTIYQFYAKTLAQGQTIPRCPENPAFRMQKIVSNFSISTGRAAETEAPADAAGGGDPAEEAKMEAAMSAMEKEFSSVDENDPRAMARMMRRMAELTGEKIDGEMEEVVRKLEEGADPDSLEDQFGGGDNPGAGGMDDPSCCGGACGTEAAAEKIKEAKFKFRPRKTAARRDPALYDYE
jgi:hypothetical protein